MKKLLLCPPTHYDIRYEINPWMNIDNPIDHVKAQEEYKTLTYAYRALDIEYNELPPVEGLPDQVFTTDLGHAEGNQFIQANFKYPERQKEALIASEYFRERKFEIKTLPPEIYFEGGDLLKVGKRYLFGYGKRSSYEALPRLEELLDSSIIAIELPDDTFYHLDTCVAPLSDDIALMNPEALNDEGLAVLRSTFATCVETSTEDNDKLVCNALPFGTDLILSAGVSNELKDQLIALGFRICTVPMTEYLKGGGGIHCVSLEIL
ncbi:hypothetical protein KBD81_00615 [Candidatus Woesebacteria bacterium]|nr:hypothetical protein [Candidatus Woesebacteria bacterium]